MAWTRLSAFNAVSPLSGGWPLRAARQGVVVEPASLSERVARTHASHVYRHVHTYVQAYTFARVRVGVCVYMSHVHTYVHAYTFACVRVGVCVYKYI